MFYVLLLTPDGRRFYLTARRDWSYQPEQAAHYRTRTQARQALKGVWRGKGARVSVQQATLCYPHFTPLEHPHDPP